MSYGGGPRQRFVALHCQFPVALCGKASENVNYQSVEGCAYFFCYMTNMFFSGIRLDEAESMTCFAFQVDFTSPSAELARSNSP